MSFYPSLPLILGNLRGSEWIILALIFLLLFGGAATIRKLMRKPIEQTAAPKPDEPAANQPAADNTPAPGAPANPRAAAKDVDR